MKQKLLLCLVSPLLTMVPALHAATTVNGVTLGAIPGLSANSSFAIWDTLNVSGLSGTGSFPGTTMWAPQAAQAGSNQNGTLTRLIKKSNGPAGGGPYAASGSIYFGGFSDVVNNNGGTLGLSSGTPLDNLKTVVFQMQIGEAWGYDLHNHALPSITYTLEGDATTYALTAAASSVYDKKDNGTVPMPTGDETVYINSYAIWFDFSAVTGDVSSFDVTWTGVQHAQLYGVSLQQDSVAASASILPPAAVPEPSALLLGALGGLFLLRRRR